VQIIDVSGRLVRIIPSVEVPRGKGFVDWDGKNQAGAAVPNGLYFVRVLNSRQVIGTTRVVVTR
jgi:flagellar hook assembly protein FlgD